MSFLPSPHLQDLRFVWVFNCHLGEWELMDPAAPFLSAFCARGWLNSPFYCWGAALRLGSGTGGLVGLGGEPCTGPGHH